MLHRLFSLAFAGILLASSLIGCATSGAPPSGDEQPHTEGSVQTDQADETAQRLETLLADAKDAYENRIVPEDAHRAVQLWNEALEEEFAPALDDNERVEIYVNLARAHYFIARYHIADGPTVDDSTDLSEPVDTGIAAAEAALGIVAPGFHRAITRGAPYEAELPDAPLEAGEALLWYAKHLDLMARTADESTALSVRPVADAAMEHVAEHHSDAHFGAADRYFGSRSVNRLFRRNESDSAAAFDRSLETAPKFLTTRVLRARHLAVFEDDREGFETELQTVIDTESDALPEASAENKMARQWAEQLLEQTDAFFGE